VPGLAVFLKASGLERLDAKLQGLTTLSPVVENHRRSRSPAFILSTLGNWGSVCKRSNPKTATTRYHLLCADGTGNGSQGEGPPIWRRGHLARSRPSARARPSGRFEAIDYGSDLVWLDDVLALQSRDSSSVPLSNPNFDSSFILEGPSEHF
jgi:hypothetical protein